MTRLFNRLARSNVNIGEAGTFPGFDLQQFAGVGVMARRRGRVRGQGRAPAPAAAGAGAQGSGTLKPFRPSTRQRIQRILAPNVPLSLTTASFGSTASIQLPQVGFLSRIFIFVNLQVNDSAASPSVTQTTFGPWNFLKRISLISNLGTANIVDISGYGLYVLNKMLDPSVDLKTSLPEIGSTDTIFQYPSTYVQNTPKTLSYCLMIPVSINDGLEFHLGLINLQAPELRVNLNFQFGNISDIYTTSDTITLTGGSVDLAYEYYEVPKPDEVDLPPRTFHRILEDRLAFNQVGPVTYLVPRQGVLQQLIHTVSLNGARSLNNTDVVSRQIVVNKTDTVYNQQYLVDRLLNRFRYGPGEIPASSFAWDLYNAIELPSRGDLRDVLDTEAPSTLESIININSAATLGSNNNFIDTVRRIFQGY